MIRQRRCRSSLVTTDAYGLYAQCELLQGHDGPHQAWMHGLGRIKTWPKRHVKKKVKA